MTILRLYMQLTKARLSSLVLLTTAVGFVLGADHAGSFDPSAFAATLVGCALAAGCANALNQVLEVARDAAMQRTRRRPLPSRSLSRRHAVILALALGVTGVTLLALFANATAASLTALTIAVYVLLYTPMKVRSTLNTLVGAVCGAIPPMIGWAGAARGLDTGAWVLASLLFVWQIPHFLALAWLYREDYARGRFVMLPVHDHSGRITGRIVVLTSLLLVPVTLMATLLGLGGWVFTLGSLTAGAWLLFLGVRLCLDRTDGSARRVFVASLVYLSTVLVLLLADRGPVPGRVPVEVVAVVGAE